VSPSKYLSDGPGGVPGGPGGYGSAALMRLPFTTGDLVDDAMS
jgi:hypothetical protein